MKIKPLLTGAFLAVAAALSAQTPDTEVTLLTLHLAGGTVEQFNLPDHPVITFEGDDLNVASATLEATYPRADVEYFNFEKGKPVVAAEQIEAGASLSVVFDGHSTLTVAAPGLRSVAVADTSGHIVAKATAADSCAVVDLQGVAAGVYIVSPEGHRAFKIIIR